MDSPDGQNFVLSNGHQQKVGCSTRVPQPDDGDSAGNFLLAALSADGYVAMEGL
jgi:hypothetical protein